MNYNLIENNGLCSGKQNGTGNSINIKIIYVKEVNHLQVQLNMITDNLIDYDELYSGKRNGTG
jgi:hypothetical protein